MTDPSQGDVPYETIKTRDGISLLRSRARGVHQVAPLGTAPPEIPPSRGWIVIGWDEDPAELASWRIHPLARPTDGNSF